MFKKKMLLCSLIFFLCGFSLCAASILELSSELYTKGVEETKIFIKLQKQIKAINSPKDCEKLNEKDSGGFSAFQYLAITPGTDDIFSLALDKYNNYMPYQLYSFLNDPINNMPFADKEYNFGNHGLISDVIYKNFNVFLYILYNEGMSPKIDLLLSDSRFNNLLEYNTEGRIETKSQSFRIRPLTYAVRSGNKKLVDLLLSKKVEVNYEMEKSFLLPDGTPAHITELTPLIDAILAPNFNIDLIKILLDNNANINVGYTYTSEHEHYENYSPLFVAIDHSDFNLFETIYSLYTDPASEKVKVLGKDWTTEYSPLHWAINKEVLNEAIIERLFDAETSQQTVKKEDGKDYTAAELLLAREDISTALRNRVKNVDGEVKIFEAIEKSDYEIVHSVLEDGMEANIFKNNHSAFEYAVSKAKDNNGNEVSLKIVEDLLAHGANVNAICNGGKTMFVSLLLESIDKGLDDTTRNLLRLFAKYGVDTKIPANENLPILHYVVKSIGQRVDKEIISFLVEEDFKLDINQRVQGGEYNNWTPLLFAIKNGNAEIVQFLIDKGAKVNIEVKQDETNLFTPLALSLLYLQSRCASILLDNGAIQTDVVSVWGADNVSMLMLACATTDWSLVSRFLDNPELKINDFDSQGKNSFMYTAQYNKDPTKAIKILRNLRGRKAIITHVDNNGNNAYTLGFINKQHGDTLLWLLEYGVPFQYKVSDIEMYVDNIDYYNVLKDICDIK